MQPEVVLLTTAELAEQFRVHPSTIRRWIEDGRISAITLPGGLKRYRKSEVEAILAGEHRSPAGAA